MITKNSSWLLILPSVVLGLLIVELFYRLFVPFGVVHDVRQRLQRVVFLDGRPPIFRNEGDLFTYLPNNDIRNLTGFLSDDDFTIEYDYRFRTNNYGLVQENDIAPGRASLLLLGDLFTEGQGADPWFRQVSPGIENLGLQPINGGLLGTGFEQWLRLDRYLAATGIRSQKVLVLFISFDYIRPGSRNGEFAVGRGNIINFRPPELACLTDLSTCRLDAGIIYRMPPPNELPAWIAKIRAARAPMTQKSWLATYAEALLPATYHVYQYLSNVEERLQHASMILHSIGAEDQSGAAIRELVRTHGPDNIAFLHLPQKDEVERGEPIKFGVKARQAIREAGGKLVDGFKLCQLSPSDYYYHDDHPNSAGYAKIAACASRVIQELAANAP